MEVKICFRCKEEKVLDEFNRHKSRKDGYDSQCRACSKESNKRYREKNPDKVKERSKRYYEENKERLKEKYKRYREANPEQVREYNKRYREANPDKVKENKKRYREANWEKKKEYHKRYREENKDKLNESNKRYYEENKEKIKERYKRYRKKNWAKVRESEKRYHNKRIQEDELYKIICTARRVIRTAIRRRGYTKNSRTYEILGCSYEEFKVYIEKQFKVGMNWDNYGDWHLDHIIPVSYGLNEQEVMALNHYSNFQPLWADENISKGNRYIG